MQRYFTRTFIGFFVGFLCIVGVALVIAGVVGTQYVEPVDNTAAQS